MSALPPFPSLCAKLSRRNSSCGAGTDQLHVRHRHSAIDGARLQTITRISYMPLTAAQLKHLEVRLNDERARLLGQLHEFVDTESAEDTQELAGDLSKFPTHPADIGTDMANEELEASISTRVSAEISEINAALDRITTSPETFGVDEQTGEDIPFERLDIIPYARIAVER